MNNHHQPITIHERLSEYSRAVMHIHNQPITTQQGSVYILFSEDVKVVDKVTDTNATPACLHIHTAVTCQSLSRLHPHSTSHYHTHTTLQAPPTHYTHYAHTHTRARARARARAHAHAHTHTHTHTHTGVACQSLSRLRPHSQAHSNVTTYLHSSKSQVTDALCCSADGCNKQRTVSCAGSTC